MEIFKKILENQEFCIFDKITIHWTETNLRLLCLEFKELTKKQKLGFLMALMPRKRMTESLRPVSADLIRFAGMDEVKKIPGGV